MFAIILLLNLIVVVIEVDADAQGTTSSELVRLISIVFTVI